MSQTNAKAERDAHLATLVQLAKAAEPTRPGLARILRNLGPHVPPAVLADFVAAAETVSGQTDAQALSCLTDVLVQGRSLRLWGSALQFQSRHALEVIMDEILVRQEYHFRSTQAAPTVIDAGSNVGLCAYYARRMCKAGRVICFEPNPDTFAVLQDNATRNNWSNVELHQAAVSTQDGTAQFSLAEEAPLAAALAPRNTDVVTGQVQVETRDLRPFLDQPIGLLKIDIEGAEADVLEVCADALGQVENIFVEVHPIQGQTPSLLLRVLKVLEEAGFMVHSARSPWSEVAHNARPLLQAHRTYSLSVFGTRLTPEQV